jgi:hypothetical protein
VLLCGPNDQQIKEGSLLPGLKFNQNLGGFNVKTKTQKTASRRDFTKLTTTYTGASKSVVPTMLNRVDWAA